MIKALKIYTVLCFMLISASTVVASSKEEGDDDKKKHNAADLLGTVNFDMGLNFLRNAPSIMGINAFQSKTAGLYYMREFTMNDKFTFNPAIGITMDRYSFDQNVQLGYVTTNIDSLAFGPLVGLAGDTLSLKRSKLATTYIEAPIEVRYYFKGHKNNGLFISFGGFIGMRLESHTKINFLERGIKKLEKKKGEFQQEKFRYGIQGRFGFKSVNIFYKHSLSPIFGGSGPAGTSDTAFTTIGISISGL